MLPSLLRPSKELVLRYALSLMLCQCFSQRHTAKGSVEEGRQAQRNKKGVVLAQDSHFNPQTHTGIYIKTERAAITG